MPNYGPKLKTYVKLKPLFKHYLKNEIAYTEDHIPVRKLHIFGIPTELTLDALLDYFTQNYGQVLSIDRIEDSDEEHKNRPTWSAFALFAHARDAAIVLRSSKRRVDGYLIFVQASFSWLQPDADVESNELEYSSSPPVFQLNDDCLEYVFQYLTLADHIRLARTCSRFRTFYQNVSARRHKTVCYSITRNLTLWETWDFCQLSGNHVESLSYRGVNKAFPMGEANFLRSFYAGPYFTNLRELDVFDELLKTHKLQRILLGMNKLEELRLSIYFPRTDRLELAQLTKLKYLRITDWNTESLSLPNSIEALTLDSWEKFSCLPKILKNHTQIKKLQIFGTSTVFKEMAKSQAFASVEILRITRNDFCGVNLMAQLPKLKKLCLNLDVNILPEIIKHNPQQLDHLEISGPLKFTKEVFLQITSLIGLHTLVLGHPPKIDCKVITKFRKLTELKRFGLDFSYIKDSFLLQLLTNCPKLSALRLEDCRNISENLVNSIISLVQKEIQTGKNQRELPFKIHFCDYRFKNIIQTKSDVVKVTFGYCSMHEWFYEEVGFKY